MQILKTLQCGLITRTIQYKKKHIFISSLSWAFKLDGTKVFIEPEMWPIIAKYADSLKIWEEGYLKERAEFMVIGDAINRHKDTVQQMAVEASLGELTKTLLVTGDRQWSGIGTKKTPQPFASMTLDYAHAFGGQTYLKNPIGKGAEEAIEDEKPIRYLPNVEYPDHVMISPRDKPKAASFYPKDLIWEERQQLAGTYDEKYINEAMPGFPDDINWRFFNAADKDQQFDRMLTGNEPFRLVNMNAEHHKIEGKLPDVMGRCFVNQVVRGEAAVDETVKDGKRFIEIPLQLDTVWFFPNHNMGVIIHRGSIEVADIFASDITHILCSHENKTDIKRSVEHYREQMALRTDPAEGFKYLLNTEALLPLGVTCAIKDLMGSGDVKLEQAGLASMQKFVENQRANATEELGKHDALANEQLAAVGMSMEDVKKKQAEMSQQELPPEAAALALLMNKIMPGITEKNADIDLTKLNLKAMDEVDAYLKNMAKERKELAIKELEKQLVQLRNYPADMPGVKEGIPQIEKMIEDIKHPPKPLLPRLQFPELDDELKKYNAKAQELLDGIGDEAAKVDLEQKLALNYAGIAAKTAEVKAVAQSGYRQGAHFLDDCRSQHEGKEAELRERLKLKMLSRESCANDDYAFCDLSGMDLSGMDFTGCYFEYAIINNTSFKEANLTNAIFAKAKIKDSNFDNAIMKGANLGACEIENTSFNSAVIDDFTIGKSKIKSSSFKSCQFSQRQDQFLSAELDGVDMSGALLQKQNFIDVMVNNVNFNGADLSSSVFINTEANKLQFNSSNLAASNFIKVKLHDASFSAAQLDNTRFVGGCQLDNAKFNNAIIKGSNLRDCSLVNSDFANATVHKTDFGNSDLTNATFTRADCYQSQYMMANLTGSHFDNANLMEASFMQADLRKAKFKYANMYAANFFGATLGGTDFSDANLFQTILKDWQPPK